MSDPIEVTKVEGGESLRSSIRGIGTVELKTARGVVVADELPGLATMLFEHGEAKTIVVLTYCTAHGRGSYSQLDADGARKVGASLIHLANLLDGKVN